MWLWDVCTTMKIFWFWQSVRFGPVPNENLDHTTTGDGLDDQRGNSGSGELCFKIL